MSALLSGHVAWKAARPQEENSQGQTSSLAVLQRIFYLQFDTAVADKLDPRREAYRVVSIPQQEGS